MPEKEWSQFTEKEINNIKKKKCLNCKYSSGANIKTREGEIVVTNLTCEYLNRTKKRRDQRPDKCKHYLDK